MTDTPTNHPANNEPGGRGVTLGANPHESVTDAKLVRRAIRNRWPVTKESQQAVHDRMAEIVEDGTSEAAKVAASKAIIAMVDANIRIEMEEDKHDTIKAGGLTENVGVVHKIIRGVDPETI